ncbi:amidase [Paenibacillus sp. GP183]|uniref:amidase n=1 Tax=Paenibacillus sp. GP183 TaxID=1882751 RepID=UPI00089430FB|nr:amidase [Paenibacillus sp. GP183]SEB72657.1 aspartyl-tRNA(Asn)/glutamyl-tRNA(Gln) amidotransferase subunit A [Paenibacillus sp. GP183]
MIAIENDLTSLVHMVKTKQISSVELVKYFLSVIEQKNSEINAWVTILGEQAIEQAKLLERKIMAGEDAGYLAGIPFSVKDIFFTSGIKTTCGSKVMGNYVSNYDAAAVSKLKNAGGILLGKNTTAEFAFSHLTQTRNPWNLAHSPGGSSSGSAAAVASGMTPFSLGSQTGGSLIRPAAYCGLVALKPTLGRLSRYGVIPVSWTLDHIGALTKTVQDQALVLNVMSGYDKNDPISLRTEKIQSHITRLKNLNGIKIGVPKRYFDNIEEDVRVSINKCIQNFIELGAVTIDIDLPESFESAVSAQAIISHSEASSYHMDTYIKKKDLYGESLRYRLAVGMSIPQTAYVKALQVRKVYIQQMQSILNSVDVMITPSAPNTAPEGYGTGDQRFNSPFTLAGVPSLTIPCGVSKLGLPIGCQLVGKALSEESLLRFALLYEESHPIGRKV